MAAVRCPQCEIPLTSGEAAAGKCPVCKAAVAATPSRPYAAGLPRPAAAGAGPAGGACDLCGRAHDGTQTRCVRVSTQSIGITGSVHAKWIDIRCRVCPRCYGRARGLTWLPVVYLAGMFFAPAVGAAVGGGLATLVQMTGTPTRLEAWIALGACFGFCAWMFLLGPLYVRWGIRRAMQGIFQGSPNEEMFRALMGVRGWGFWSRLHVFADPPADRSLWWADLNRLPHRDRMLHMDEVRRAAFVSAGGD